MIKIMKKIIIIFSGLVAAAIIGFVLMSNKKAIDNAKVVIPSNPNGVPVTTELVKNISTENKLVLSGTTIPIRETQIAATTSGELSSINFGIGSQVGKGTVLAKIDDKMKNLAFENASIAASKYEIDYNKMKNMYENGAATESQLRELKFAYDNAVNRKKQTKRELEYTQVTAPFSGIVTEKMTELGAYMNPGTPICKITDISSLKISVNVSEKDAYQLTIGIIVKITCHLFPTSEFSGKILYISPISDKGHNYTIEISVANAKNNHLKAGTFVKAEIELDQNRTALMIPKAALIGSANDAKTYVVENGIVILKNIKIGSEYDQMVEVLDGLKENDEVVTSGHLNLDNNSKVKVINNK